MDQQDYINIPRDFAGKWIAWSHDRRRIVACGVTLPEARNAAQAVGESDPVFDKVPRANAWFVGAGL